MSLVAEAAGPERKPLTVLYARVATREALLTDAVNYDAMANYRHHFAAQELVGANDVVAGTCLPYDDLGYVRERLAAYAETGLDLLCLYPHGLAPAERERVFAAVAAIAA